MVWDLLVAREVVCILMIVNWVQPRMFYRSIKSILKSGEITILKSTPWWYTALLLPLHSDMYLNNYYVFISIIIIVSPFLVLLLIIKNSCIEYI